MVGITLVISEENIYKEAITLAYHNYDQTLKEDLVSRELDALTETQLNEASTLEKVNNLSYDQRILLFQHLSKSLLFARQSVTISDLLYWFPECESEELYNHFTISKEDVSVNLELIIAELMEGNFEFMSYYSE